LVACSIRELFGIKDMLQGQSKKLSLYQYRPAAALSSAAS